MNLEFGQGVTGEGFLVKEEPGIILTEAIPTWLPRIRHLVLKSVENSFGMVTVEYLEESLYRGDSTAFIMHKRQEITLLAIVNIVQYSTYKAARIIALAGKNMPEAHKYMGYIELWALAKEAVEIEGWCRPVMERYVHRFGFKHRVSLVIKDLRGTLQ